MEVGFRTSFHVVEVQIYIQIFLLLLFMFLFQPHYCQNDYMVGEQKSFHVIKIKTFLLNIFVDIY